MAVDGPGVAGGSGALGARVRCLVVSAAVNIGRAQAKAQDKERGGLLYESTALNADPPTSGRGNSQ